MNVIYLRTFFVSYVLFIALCTVVIGFLWWQNRKRHPEIALWLTNYILQFIAILLVTFRGLIPDFFSIILANVFIIGGTIIFYTGLCRYLGKEPRQWHNFIMLFVFTLLHAYLTYIYPSAAWRTINQSVAVIFICSQASWLMLSGADKSLRSATRPAGFFFAVFCLIGVIQIIVNLTIRESHDIIVSGSFGIVSTMMYQISFVALTFALFLLVSQRLSTKLESELFQRTRAEWALQERFKELNCLYSISSLIELSDMSSEELLKKIICLLPPAWQFPEITEVRITLEGQTFHTERFRETPWMLASKIIVNGTPVGEVRVCYLEERPIRDEGPFLIEERQLINAVAERIGRVIERNRAEETLRESEERISAITNSANDAITMMDNNGNISYWNPAARRILGYTSAEAIGQNLHKLITPERFLPAFLTAFPEFQQTGRGNAIGKTLELAARRKDGREIDVALSLSAVNIKGAWHSVGIIQDITERKKNEEQIQYLATHDLLTGLPSIGLARDRLSLALDMARRYKKAVALMFVDLDGFKAVNDTFGHEAGDYMLQQVAQRLLSCVRETDTVARFGGDEFLIIASEINTPENAARIAEKVIQTISQPVLFNGQEAVVGTSIGIALFPDDGENMDQLIKQADKAMYSVKNAGKNGFRFVNS